MKIYFYFFVLVFVTFQMAEAQLIYVYEDNGDSVEVVGNWKSVNYEDCHGGSALYTRKGDGAAWVQWNFAVDYPGLYQVATYVRNYKYGKDTRWTINTTQGDTTVIINEYYNPGWRNLGTFDLTAKTHVRVTNYFESDTGDYVYADAIRLTSAMPLYVISGSLELNGENQAADAVITLEQYGIQEPIVTAIFSQWERQFYFDNLTPGYYKITCFAWGYDTLVVDSLAINENDISDLALTLQQSSGATYSISGILSFDDQSSDAVCTVDLINNQSGLFVSSDTVKYLESYSLPYIPNGTYRLEFKADGYIDDLETHSELIVDNADVELDTLILYAYFQFAWITDSHVGAGFTEAGLQAVIRNINQAADEELQFVIHTGDLTEKGLSGEISQYFGYINDCNLPVYSIPGNHDTKWTESGLEAFKSRNNGTTHFSFDYKGYHFVGINSGIPMRGGGGYIDPAELKWLKEDLDALPENTLVIACVHHPADAGGIFNNWKFLDLLKNYHTIFIMVGHGHSNRYYDFEKLPGAMGLDTYSATSGYNVVRVSKKDITVATHYTGSSLASPWLTVPYQSQKQPEITFTDLNEFDLVTTSRTVNIHISEPAVSGRYEIMKDAVTGVLDGGGQDWSLTLPLDGMINGYHTLTVWLKLADGNEYCRTVGYYIEKGYPFCEWKYNTGSEIISSPAYDDKNAYFGALDGKIYALSLTDGRESWPPIMTAKTIFSSPYVYDGILYIGSSNGLLYAISADSGKILWTYDAEKAILNAVTGVDTLVYFAANSKMIALHAKTGENIWNFNVGGTIECRPAIEGNNIVFGSWDTKLYCLNRFDGTQLWKWADQTSFYYSPAACWPVTTADRVFISDPARYLYAINLNTGSTIWKSKSPETWESVGISERKSQVYIRSLDGNLYAFSASASSQQLEWSAPVGYGWDSTPSMPIGVRGAVISGSKNGFVVSVAQSNGQIGWKYWVSHGYVTTVTPIDGGTVLAAALDGTIMLIKADPSLSIDSQTTTGMPDKTEFLPAYPNPFNNMTRIRYSLKSGQNVTIQIYNLLGERIYTLNRRHDKPGQYSWTWHGKDMHGKELSSGLYILQMISGNYSKSRKIMFLK